MKKLISFMICMALIVSLAGCGSSSGSASKTGGSNAKGVDEVLEEGMAEADAEAAAEETAAAAETVAAAETAAETAAQQAADIPETIDVEAVVSSTEGIDVDLTKLSSTMVYSEVYNMMNSPEDYVGKTVKMIGMSATYHDQETDSYYYACVIADAAACCSQGIEYILPEGQEYPKEKVIITVTGVFDTYQEGEYRYCTLRDAELKVG